MDCPELVNQDLRYRSFLIQSKRVNIVASDVAKQQRRVYRIQPHPPTPPSRIVPILQIGDLLYRATPDTDSKHTNIAHHVPEVDVPAISGPLGRIHRPLLWELQPLLRLEVENFQVGVGDEVAAVRRPARPTQALRSRKSRDLAAVEVDNPDDAFFASG